MAAITRKSLRGLRSTQFTLATADDLDGTVNGTQAIDVSGASRVLIIQDNSGTNGTAGIDVIEVSYDGGTTWAAATDVLPVAQDDTTGTVQASGALNAAGAEPTRAAFFTCGPYDGPTFLRCARLTTTTSGTTWVTGAPAVYAIVFGGTGHNGGAPTTQA